jgi:hypothetical protein
VGRVRCGVHRPPLRSSQLEEAEENKYNKPGGCPVRLCFVQPAGRCSAFPRDVLDSRAALAAGTRVAKTRGGGRGGARRTRCHEGR